MFQTLFEQIIMTSVKGAWIPYYRTAKAHKGPSEGTPILIISSGLRPHATNNLRQQRTRHPLDCFIVRCAIHLLLHSSYCRIRCNGRGIALGAIHPNYLYIYIFYFFTFTFYFFYFFFFNFFELMIEIESCFLQLSISTIHRNCVRYNILGIVSDAIPYLRYCTWIQSHLITFKFCWSLVFQKIILDINNCNFYHN